MAKCNPYGSNEDHILDTVENAFAASPELEGCDVKFGKRRTGEDPNMRMMTITVNNTRLTIVARGRKTR